MAPGRPWLGLSVRPPWSWAIAHGPKDVENRSGGAARWRRALDANLMIHASGGWSESGAWDRRVDRAYQSAMNHARGPVPLSAGLQRPQRVAGLLVHHTIALQDPQLRILHGAVIAAVSLSDVHDAAPGCCESEWAEYRYTDASGQVRTDVVHLVVDSCTALPSDGVAARGRLGLWHPDPELIEDVEDLLGWES